jgi:hypothetical protein
MWHKSLRDELLCSSVRFLLKRKVRESYKTLHFYRQQLKSWTIYLLSRWNIEAAFSGNETGAAVCVFQLHFATSVDFVLTWVSLVMLSSITTLLTVSQSSQIYIEHQFTKVGSLSHYQLHSTFKVWEFIIIIIIIIYFKCNWVDTRWQQYSTYLHTNTRWQQYSTYLHTNSTQVDTRWQ